MTMNSMVSQSACEVKGYASAKPKPLDRVFHSIENCYGLPKRKSIF